MVDRYTKLVLTVIAICLVWIALGGPSLLTPVNAQQGGLGDRVILAGWVDTNGTVRQFPNPYPPTGNRKAWRWTGADSVHRFTGLEPVRVDRR